MSLSHYPVLIAGETGTGKGVLAKWLHDQSPRAEEPFVDLNCAGLGRDLLETELFGHEAGAFTGASQRKLGLLEMAQRGPCFSTKLETWIYKFSPSCSRSLKKSVSAGSEMSRNDALTSD